MKKVLIPKILICRPDRIGDVVLSTAIPREIKNVYPQSFVAVLLSEYTKDVYINNPFVDEIILLRKNNFNFIKRIRNYNFTHAFMLLPAEKINWILFFAGIKYRIGVGDKFYQFISNTKSVYRYKYIPLRHEADYCLDFIRKLGINPQSNTPEIFLTQGEKNKAKEFKKSICSNNEILIGINSTSGNSAPNILPEEYEKLIDKLLPNENIKIAVMDFNVPKTLQDIDGVIYPNIGNTLRDSIINFSALDLLISASTGPMHIAAALNIKTLSVFTRTSACSPQLWGPLGNTSKIILPSEEYDKNICEPDPKNCNFSGDGGINAQIIFNSVKDFLNII